MNILCHFGSSKYYNQSEASIIYKLNLGLRHDSNIGSSLITEINQQQFPYQYLDGWLLSKYCKTLCVWLHLTLTDSQGKLKTTFNYGSPNLSNEAPSYMGDHFVIENSICLNS